MKLNCTGCRKPIPTGEAVIRSVSLNRVAYHRDCAVVAGIVGATDAEQRVVRSLAS